MHCKTSGILHSINWELFKIQSSHINMGATHVPNIICACRSVFVLVPHRWMDERSYIWTEWRIIWGYDWSSQLCTNLKQLWNLNLKRDSGLNWILAWFPFKHGYFSGLNFSTIKNPVFTLLLSLLIHRSNQNWRWRQWVSSVTSSRIALQDFLTGICDKRKKWYVPWT